VVAVEFSGDGVVLPADGGQQDGTSAHGHPMLRLAGAAEPLQGQLFIRR
jgi:hypothetical protein